MRQPFNTIMKDWANQLKRCELPILPGLEMRRFEQETAMYLRITGGILLLLLTIGAARGADDPQITEAMKILKSGNAAAQIEATDVLGRYGTAAKSAVPALVDAVKSSDAQLQWHAARALSMMGSEAADAVPALTAALNSKEAAVRGHSANALQEIGPASRPAASALTVLLSDKDGDVRRAALDALIAIRPDPKTFVPVLKQILEDASDVSLAVVALNALAEQGDAGIAVLIEELKHDKARYGACIALAEAGPKAKAAVPE